jgi:hypothetical protein
MMMSRSVIFACSARFGDFVSHLGGVRHRGLAISFIGNSREHVTEWVSAIASNRHSVRFCFNPAPALGFPRREKTPHQGLRSEEERSRPTPRQHDTVFAEDLAGPNFRPVVKPARLQPLTDAPRSWPSTRLRIAFVQRPQRYRYRRYLALRMYDKGQGESIFVDLWNTLISTNWTKSIGV